MITKEERAKQLVNNHANFKDWSWWTRPEDSKYWTIYYTHHRDSDLVDQSNAHIIDESFNPFFENDSDNILKMDMNHWAVGWVKGYAIRVYKPGSKKLTDEFIVLCDILERLESYPLLDEEHYSELEYAAIIWAIEDALKYIYPDYTESELDQVISYFWDTANDLYEDWYPEEEEIKAALDYCNIEYKED